MEGRTWSLSEVPEFGGNMTSDCPIQSDRWPDPPAVIRQHASCQRSFVALSAQVSFRVFQPFVFPSCPRCPSCPGCPSCNPSYLHCPSCPGCPGCITSCTFVTTWSLWLLYQQGSYLFTTYRPVEQLCQLLLHSQGFDSDAVQAFFKLHKVKKMLGRGLLIIFFVLIYDGGWCNMKIWFIKGNVKMVNIDLLSCRWTGRPGMCNVSCFGLWCNRNPTTSESNTLVLNST